MPTTAKARAAQSFSLLAATDTPETPTSSAQRALNVLDFVAHTEAPGLMDIATALRLPKATAFRLCAGLAAGGWLIRRDSDKRYAPGPRLRTLAQQVQHTHPQQALRHQLLAELVAQLDETCNLTALDGTKVLYLDRVETHWPLRMQLDVGSRVPLHATASGKLFLAHMPPARRQTTLAKLPLPPLTPHTLTTAAALQRECEDILQLGYACDREEYLAGLVAVAVPVLDGMGICRAAIAVHAPVARMPLAQAITSLPAIQHTARLMSDLF